MIHSFFGKDSIDLEGLSSFLDACEGNTRIASVRSFSAKEQARLFLMEHRDVAKKLEKEIRKAAGLE